MEILFISHKYPPSIGGMQKHSYELATRLEKYCTVHKIIYEGDQSVLRFFWNLKIQIKNKLEQHPDISLIYLNDGVMAGFNLWLKQYTHIPVVATLHGLDVVFPNRYFQNNIISKFCLLDGIISVSQPTAQECIKRGMPKNKVYTIKNGIDHDIAAMPNNPNYIQVLEQKTGKDLKHKKLIVGLGRPVKRKGFSWFIKNVLPQLPEDVIFLLIGPEGNTNSIFQKLPFFIRNQIELFFGMGSDGFEIRQLSKHPELKDRFIRLGKLPFKDLIQTIKIADLFVVPNCKVEGDFEGFGLVALEAAICGTPVIASAVDGLKDAIVDSKNGYQVPPEDTTTWVNKIQTLLASSNDLRQFGEQAKRFTMEHFNWDKMVRSYHEVFRQIVLKKKIRNEIKLLKQQNSKNKQFT